MMTLIAAALVAAQPAAPPAQAHSEMPMMQKGEMPMMQKGEMPMMQMGQSADHKAMPCCKDGCKDMGAKDAEHKGHPAQ